MTTRRSGLVTLALMAQLFATTLVHASSHREAPAISIDPTADNTDVYAWVSPGKHDKLYVVTNFNPLEEPGGGPNFNMFDPDVRYEVHIARGPESLADAVTYYIRFKTTPFKRVSSDDIAFNEDLKRM